MNEYQIRERLRQAVGEANYPPHLTSEVESRLRSSAGARGRRGLAPWPIGPGRTGTLVAALLVALLVATLVVGVNAWRGGIVNRPPVTAVQGPSVKQYQTMQELDSQAVLAAQSNNCATLTDTCPVAAAAVVSALQKWLDDLNANKPPARFTYIDLQMRRQIPVVIADLNAAVAAYEAKDQKGMDAAINAAIVERDALESEVSDIISSIPATVSTYTANVRAENANLLGCAACHRLASQKPASCSGSQATGCVSDVAAARVVVEAFQSVVVSHFAPAPLIARDARLQADLFDADAAIAAMGSAIQGGDEAALAVASSALRQALSRIDSDATAVFNAS